MNFHSITVRMKNTIDYALFKTPQFEVYFTLGTNNEVIIDISNLLLVLTILTTV